MIDARMSEFEEGEQKQNSREVPDPEHSTQGRDSKSVRFPPEIIEIMADLDPRDTEILSRRFHIPTDPSIVSEAELNRMFDIPSDESKSKRS